MMTEFIVIAVIVIMASALAVALYDLVNWGTNEVAALQSQLPPPKLKLIVSNKFKNNTVHLNSDEKSKLVTQLQDLFMKAISDLYTDDPRSVAGWVAEELTPFMEIEVEPKRNDEPEESSSQTSD